jgi:hypothetical protein
MSDHTNAAGVFNWQKEIIIFESSEIYPVLVVVRMLLLHEKLHRLGKYFLKTVIGELIKILFRSISLKNGL